MSANKKLRTEKGAAMAPFFMTISRDCQPMRRVDLMRFSARKIVAPLAALGISGVILIFAGLYAYAGLYGGNAVLKRGGTVFATVTPDDKRISESMRLALVPEPPRAEAALFSWAAVQPGFEVAELPVVAAGKTVDSISRRDVAGYRTVESETDNC